MPTDEGVADERCHDALFGLVLRLEHQLQARMVGGTDAYKEWRRRGFSAAHGIGAMRCQQRTCALLACDHARGSGCPLPYGHRRRFLIPHPPRRAV
jgi:hypothetical protein